jgi:patatin-like phospholipase/acyl hydrolase
MELQPFRILSLDGGGMKGAFAASVLATFEQATGRRFVEHFDLITGTSAGGIIAIGLAMGATAEEICRFYETEGDKLATDKHIPCQARSALTEPGADYLSRPGSSLQ